ncbi:MAG TPA: PhnD/SsuA/transferrin family substrate-binding protein [Gammaproteobacteria bacterium]|nr:PhnD/SsuA/transferrin family substrate-binding protein [Gammaproteobacteria bacterium]
MTAIASLPMYDFEEIRAQTDALWRHLARAMRRAGVEEVPASLTRQDPCHELWSRRDLLFSQTCGYPMVREYRSRLRPVAVPRYAAPGCSGSEYCSAILVREGANHRDIAAFRGAVCAVNSPVSQSGYNVLRALIAPLAENGRFFSKVKLTGSHIGSIASVGAGEADICAVDCVTHALVSRYRPSALDGTRVMSYTPRCPGLPFVTRADLDADQFKRLRIAVHEAFADGEGEAIRAALFIQGVDDTRFENYRVVLEMESAAAASGYMEIR